ncbi:MAG TPA: GNAT family N-acetyltransferase [Acidimicrobiia bacterium]|jgi:CelD/BcsL family acetyltransferase involved in cellulose biosynthesis
MGLIVTDDWLAAEFDLPAVAPATGPFPGRHFLATWAHHRLSAAAQPAIVSDGAGLIPLIRDGDLWSFAGEPDLTDYHSPLGSGIVSLARRLPELTGTGARLVLDSLPKEAAAGLANGLAAAGLHPRVGRHQVAAVVDLTGGWDDFLDRLGKKNRHELFRKGRRFHDRVGPAVLEAHERPDSALPEFVRLHRMSIGEKGSFLTESLEAMFHDVATGPGWQVDLLLYDGGIAAAALAYSDPTGYYLYNSGYDPALAEASPGISLVAALLERSARAGLPRLDLLKGDEPYKFRLGAHARPLYRLEAET